MVSSEIDISIPRSLYNRILKVSKELGINDINEFIADLIRDSLIRIEDELSKGVKYSEEEIEEIRNRLKSLGYLE